MSSTRLKFLLCAGTLAVFAFLFWQQQERANRLKEDNAALRGQLEQSTHLQEENQGLANELKSTLERTRKEHEELLRLRGQAVTLKQTLQENSKLKAERDHLAKSAAAPPAAARDSLEEETLEKKLAMAKLQFGRQWGVALIMYAEDNQGQLPATFAAASRYADSDQLRTATGGYDFSENQFEIAYQGSVESVKNPSETIFIKEKEPVQRANGKWVKTYIFADGHAEIHTNPNNDFSAWEAERIVKK
jgi:hypothetical protein